jgi:hypothetical protein
MMSLLMRMPARRMALSSAEIPISDLIYRFDASQVALGATYANNIILPNHAGAGFDFKSVVSNIPSPVVQNIAGNGLYVRAGDGWDSGGYIESTTALSVGTQATTIAFVATNGSPAYYPVSHSIDGTPVTVRWAENPSPSAGNANTVEAYSYTLFKTANATFTVLASRTVFF